MSGMRRRSCLYNVQAVGWALHALEPDEEQDVLEHLPSCPSCQDAAREAERVLGGLGASIEQVDPPPSLRAGLLAQVAQTAQQPSLLSQRSSPEDSASPADTAAPEDSVEPEDRAEPAVAASPEAGARPEEDTEGQLPPVRPPFRDRRPAPSRPAASVPSARPRQSRIRRSRLVAASMVLVGLLAIGGLTAQALQLTEQRDQLTAQRDAQTAQSQALAEIVTGLDQPGTRHATLITSSGAALAAVVVHGGERTLVTSGLAPNTGVRDTYVVWGIGDGGPRPITTFDVLGTGTDVRSVGPDAPAEGFSGYAISIEPGRTSPASPSAVVAVGQLVA